MILWWCDGLSPYLLLQVISVVISLSVCLSFMFIRLRAVPFGYVMVRHYELLLLGLSACCFVYVPVLWGDSFADTSFEMWYIIPSRTPRRIQFFGWLPTSYIGVALMSGIICYRFMAPARLGTRDRWGRMLGCSHSLFIFGCDILWGRAIVPQTQEDAHNQGRLLYPSTSSSRSASWLPTTTSHAIPQEFLYLRLVPTILYCGHFWYGWYGLGCCPPHLFWGFAVIVWGFAVIILSRQTSSVLRIRSRWYFVTFDMFALRPLWLVYLSHLRLLITYHWSSDYCWIEYPCHIYIIEICGTLPR